MLPRADTGTAVTGRQLRNTKYVAQAGAGDNDPGLVQAGDGTTTFQLQNLPNEFCPLNVRFENDVSVQTLNPKVIIFDRQTIENSAVGVDTLVYESRHPLASTSAGRLDLISSASNTLVLIIFSVIFLNNFFVSIKIFALSDAII